MVSYSASVSSTAPPGRVDVQADVLPPLLVLQVEHLHHDPGRRAWLISPIRKTIRFSSSSSSIVISRVRWYADAEAAGHGCSSLAALAANPRRFARWAGRSRDTLPSRRGHGRDRPPPRGRPPHRHRSEPGRASAGCGVLPFPHLRSHYHPHPPPGFVRSRPGAQDRSLCADRRHQRHPRQRRGPPRVLADIEKRGIKRIVCLGDIVGYGPEPLDLRRPRPRALRLVLMGNHDFGVLYEPTNFNAAAESAAFWTREQFDAEPDEAAPRRALRVPRPPARPCRRDRPRRRVPHARGPRLAPPPHQRVHLPDDATNAPDKIEAIFGASSASASWGTPTSPASSPTSPTSTRRRARRGRLPLQPSEEKAIINVGSVGQPRDMRPARQLCHPPRRPRRVHARALRHRRDGQQDQGDPAAAPVPRRAAVHGKVTRRACSEAHNQSDSGSQA
jgi:hypothetical protein